MAHKHENHEHSHIIELVNEDGASIKRELVFSITCPIDSITYLFFDDLEDEDSLEVMQLLDDETIQSVFEEELSDEIRSFLNQAVEDYYDGKLVPQEDAEEDEEDHCCSSCD